MIGWIPSRDSENRLRVSHEPRKIGSGLIIVTHNFCDKTTWYQGSVRVQNEVLQDTGDGLVFQSSHPFWIDLTHGKIYREDLISASYLPVIKVDGQPVTQRAPWAESGGDFDIDYVSGRVIFFSSQSGKTITADYSYAVSSLFVISPTENKRLWIEYSEVQFSTDVQLNGSIHFQPWAYDPQNPPNKIPVAYPTTYKTIDNFVEEANGCYPLIPAMPGPRGFLLPRITFPFKYPVIKELISTYGVEIRIWIENHQPFLGEYATATFYCTSYDL